MNVSKLDKMKQRARQLLSERNWSEAKIQLEKLCKKFPRDFDSWNLHGALCGQMKDLESALKYSQKALSLNPNHASALYNYGMTLAGLGKLPEAVSAYTKAMQVSPQNPAIHHNLGNLYKDMQKYNDALEHLHISINLDPNRADALFSLATLYAELEQTDKAISYFKDSIRVDPAIRSKAEYFIAALTNVAPDVELTGHEHVKKLHDAHAATFDIHLQKGLGYKVPSELCEEYKKLANPNDKVDILDLGCGTGLCGIEFREYAKSITGVDLSPGMLDKAKLTNAYDELIEDELNHYLENTTRKFNVILSADVFIYVGRLDHIIPKCADILNEKGFIIFSVESIEGVDYKLRISGRFAHSTSYIKKLSHQSGLQLVSIKPVVIRKEMDRYIDGNIFVLEK